MRVVSLIIAIASLVTLVSGAQAQGLAGIAQQNMAFDQQMQMQIARMQQQNAAYGQQIWQNYMRQYGPWLQEQYRLHLARGNNPPLTFEQFAYWNLMTANGTNIAGAMQAQQDRFKGMQQAHQTQMQGFNDYNAAMQRNSQATMNAIDNYGRQAVQGNAPFIDPSSGATQWLPYSQPAGQVFNSGGVSYVQDQSGTYYQWQGNSWVRMQAAQR